jgi:hypothetical protein
MSSNATLLNARVAACLSELELSPTPRRGGGWSVGLPSIKRGVIGVGLLARERTVRLATFFLRAPDRDHVSVYRRLLERNLQMAYWRFGIDSDGDLFLAAQLDEDQVSVATLDAVLGLVVTYVDESYESILRLGFDVPAQIQVGPPPHGHDAWGPSNGAPVTSED